MHDANFSMNFESSFLMSYMYIIISATVFKCRYDYQLLLP